jgi:hypothetical protein
MRTNLKEKQNKSIHCLKKSYQILKEKIRRKYKFKELVKKTQQRTINIKTRDNRVIFKTNNEFLGKQAKKETQSSIK